VCSDPDVTTIQKNGSEDFLIIACDGLWDTVTPEDATNCVMNCLKETEGQFSYFALDIGFIYFA